jgi:hypothetical protein
MRHGLTARAILLREEEAEQFEALRADFFQQWCPAGEAESSQVHELAEAQWRLLRCTPMEAELLESLRDPDAPKGGLAAAFLGGREADSGALLRLARYRRTIERSFDRALHNLLLLHRVRGVWSRPNLVAPEDEENWEPPSPVNERWSRPVTHAEPVPLPEASGDENEFGNATVTVQRVIIGEDGERIPWEEYLARQQAAGESGAERDPGAEAASGAEMDTGAERASGSQETHSTESVEIRNRPKADILRNGAPESAENPDSRQVSEQPGRVPGGRRRS